MINSTQTPSPGGDYPAVELDDILPVVAVHGLEIDLDGQQRDDARTLGVYLDASGNPKIGPGPWLVTEIDLPAAEYEMVAAETPDGGDAEAESALVRGDKLPIDTGSVAIRLWRLPS